MSSAVHSSKISSSLITIAEEIQQEKINGVTVLKVPGATVTEGSIDTHFTKQIEGFTDFSFDLLREINAKEMKNVMISPHSIVSALSMVYPGAEGMSKTEFETLLNISLSEDAYNSFMYSLNHKLVPGEYTSPYAEYRESDSPEEVPFTFNMNNTNWGEQSFPFDPEFLATLNTYYEAGLNVVDFKHNFEPVRIQINKWVEAETNDKIKNILPKKSIDSLTKMVLVNTIYMKANWLNDFTEHATSDQPFTLLDGTTTSVPTMRQTAYFASVKSDDYQAISLPYIGNEYSMLIVMPETIDESISTLNSETLGTISGALKRQRTQLSLPKFKIENNYSLKEFFQNMGMTESFSSKADFSGFHAQGLPEIYISNILHKTFIEVDEKGTEAAAVTAILMAGTTSVPPDPISIEIDKPFLYFIQHNETQQILFMGQVLNPTE